uniref:CIDE-N domain-containing protein n=1 Tax=Timema genevievae TaxID=629358 RepID=A0A7R9PMK3_TIMGE|nr:unnamed protein product [Timema genevievae]
MCVYFICSFLQAVRGFKVTNSVRSRTVGVTCRSFDELVDKSCQKLDVPRKTVVVQLLDGTIVDDEEYFQTLPQQTLLIFLRPGENSLSGADILYKALKAVNLDFLQTGEQVKDFFSTDLKNKVRQLAQLISDSGRDERTTLLSSISQDPLWFQGHSENDHLSHFYSLGYISPRKEEEMYRPNVYSTDLAKEGGGGDVSTQRYSTDLAKEGGGDVSTQRYSTDLAKTGGDVSTQRYSTDLSKEGGRDLLTQRLCDDRGEFQCQGRWDRPECPYNESSRHVINPYCSKEARVLFQIWNLDHRIERSRTVVPAILEAARISVKEHRKVNSSYFFTLLFTLSNLKLVHIVCHDKGAHNVRCDSAMYFLD